MTKIEEDIMADPVKGLAYFEGEISRLPVMGNTLLTYFCGGACLYLLGWPWWSWLLMFVVTFFINGSGIVVSDRARKAFHEAQTEEEKND